MFLDYILVDKSSYVGTANQKSGSRGTRESTFFFVQSLSLTSGKSSITWCGKTPARILAGAHDCRRQHRVSQRPIQKAKVLLKRCRQPLCRAHSSPGAKNRTIPRCGSPQLVLIIISSDNTLRRSKIRKIIRMAAAGWYGDYYKTISFDFSFAS